jgi:hypothetical protein
MLEASLLEANNTADVLRQAASLNGRDLSTLFRGTVGKQASINVKTVYGTKGGRPLCLDIQCLLVILSPLLILALTFPEFERGMYRGDQTVQNTTNLELRGSFRIVQSIANLWFISNSPEHYKPRASWFISNSPEHYKPRASWFISDSPEHYNPPASWFI